MSYEFGVPSIAEGKNEETWNTEDRTVHVFPDTYSEFIIAGTMFAEMLRISRVSVWIASRLPCFSSFFRFLLASQFSELWISVVYKTWLRAGSCVQFLFVCLMTSGLLFQCRNSWNAWINEVIAYVKMLYLLTLSCLLLVSILTFQLRPQLFGDVTKASIEYE